MDVVFTVLGFLLMGVITIREFVGILRVKKQVSFSQFSSLFKNILHLCLLGGIIKLNFKKSKGKSV